MTAELDSTLPAKAAELVDRYGIEVVYTRVTGQTYTPSTGAVSGGTTTNYTMTVTPPAPVSRSMVESGFATALDSVVYFAGSGLAFEPSTGDKIAMRGKTWRVQSVQGYASGEVTALWQVTVQAGDG